MIKLYMFNALSSKIILYEFFKTKNKFSNTSKIPKVSYEGTWLFSLVHIINFVYIYMRLSLCIRSFLGNILRYIFKLFINFSGIFYWVLLLKLRLQNKYSFKINSVFFLFFVFSVFDWFSCFCFFSHFLWFRFSLDVSRIEEQRRKLSSYELTVWCCEML